MTFAGSGYEPRTLQATVAAGNVKLDLVNPLAMRDDVTGTAGNDRLVGSPGDDRLRGLDGDDFIDGGPGNDTAVYGGQRSEYAVRWDGVAALVSSARDGNDRLVRGEALELADRTEHVTPRPLEYIASYGDLIAWLGANAEGGAVHYIRHGFDESRRVSFDPAQYLANYADLRAAFGQDERAATIHYIDHGHAEGRTDHVL